jgi:hypothetical protein
MQKRKFLADTKHYFWDDPFLFKHDLVEEKISHTCMHNLDHVYDHIHDNDNMHHLSRQTCALYHVHHRPCDEDVVAIVMWHYMTVGITWPRRDRGHRMAKMNARTLDDYF